MRNPVWTQRRRGSQHRFVSNVSEQSKSVDTKGSNGSKQGRKTIFPGGGSKKYKIFMRTRKFPLPHPLSSFYLPPPLNINLPPPQLILPPLISSISSLLLVIFLGKYNIIYSFYRDFNNAYQINYLLSIMNKSVSLSVI